MAVTNAERVGKALELLKQGLRPFGERKPRAVYGDLVFRITGMGLQRGHGIDAIHALTTALEGIRVTLEQSGRRLTWVGGEPGDTGFARLVALPFGPKFTKRIDLMIDREIRQFVRALKQRRRDRSAKSAARGDSRGPRRTAPLSNCLSTAHDQ